MTVLDLVVVGDPLDRLDPAADTTLGIVSAALARGHHVRACEPADLAIVDGAAVARTYDVRRGDARWTALGDADAVLLRTGTGRTLLITVAGGVEGGPGSSVCADFVELLEATVAAAHESRAEAGLRSAGP
ncbi:hypothetical protein [Nocardioides stalactiti]|uniref:hypothetical protein n=1 Tax=Nocardioides stalactiti TaxID=2755356 RepID=UPI0016034E48|nr:hypothetical protein [Nocardioides stalactiti]